jgi:hypothetical protein
MLLQACRVDGHSSYNQLFEKEDKSKFKSQRSYSNDNLPRLKTMAAGKL